MYCTVAQVKLLSKFTVFKTNSEGVETFSDAEIQALIDRADTMIKSELSSRIDFSRVPDIGTAPPPDAITNLSIYKTTELALVTMHGPQRKVAEISDIQYWQNQYRDMVAQVQCGSVILLDPNGNTLYQAGARFRNTDSTNPAFGDTKYGEYNPAKEGLFP